MALTPYVRKGKTNAAIAAADAFMTGTNTGITASTTQTRAGGTPLTKGVSVVATAANSGDAVTLPNLGVGQEHIVFNNGANPIKVFPYAATDTIDGGSAGASVTLTNANRCSFKCVSAGVILSAKLGAVSS